MHGVVSNCVSTPRQLFFQNKIITVLLFINGCKYFKLFFNFYYLITFHIIFKKEDNQFLCLFYLICVKVKLLFSLCNYININTIKLCYLLYYYFYCELIRFITILRLLIIMLNEIIG